MKKVFEGKPDSFEAYYAAEAFARDHGYSVGSMCRDSPIGLMRGDVEIAKWRNLTPKERAACHGTITSPNFRDGPVTVEIFQPHEALTPTPCLKNEGAGDEPQQSRFSHDRANPINLEKGE